MDAPFQNVCRIDPDGTGPLDPCLANLLLPTTDLALSLRAANGLADARIVYVFQLATRTEADLMGIRNLGWKTVAEIRGIMDGLGLRLGMRLPVDISAHAIVDDARAALERFLSERKVPVSPITPVPASIPRVILDDPWERHLNVSVRIAHGFDKAGLRTLADVLGTSERDLLRIYHFGRKSMNGLRKAIADLEQRFGSPIALRRRLEDSGLLDVPLTDTLWKVAEDGLDAVPRDQGDR